MADELGVSRNTVMGAFDQLLAEGVSEGKVGSGTYVAEKLPEELLRCPRGGAKHGAGAAARDALREMGGWLPRRAP